VSPYELTITVEDKHNVRADRDDHGQKRATIDANPLRLETIEVFRGWLSQKKVTARDELKVLGKHLYELLFGGGMDAYLDATLARVPSGDRLRLQLAFADEAAELASLPWEYLFHPRKDWFFSTAVDLVLSRYMPDEEGREDTLVPPEHRVKLLIAVSQPAELEPVLEKPVIEAVRKLAESHPIDVEVLEGASVDLFLDKLDSSSPPHVVHFIGHGRFNEQHKRGEIAFLDLDADTADWRADFEFADFFKQLRAVPRLAFLHMCEGGKVDFRASFAGLAPKLIRNGVQAVVAMQYPITNKAAIAFSRAFYAELAQGTPVDHAVQVGRWRITLSDRLAYDSRVFGTPVLYMRSRDGVIQPLNVEGRGVGRTSPASP
jgi:hypothetical protein